MNAKIVSLKENTIAYIVSDEILIRSEQDALDVVGETEFQDIVLHDYNFDPSFFDLSNWTLGDVLQKFTNYHVKLAVIGDFEKYTSKVLPDFIHESNRHGDYLFVNSIDDVKKIWGVN